jgi:hypothetical protein
MADQADISASQNQVKLGYLHDQTAHIDFNGMSATVDYLGNAVVRSGFVEANISVLNANVAGTNNVADRAIGLKAGVAVPVAANVAVIPYAYVGHEVIDAGFDSANGNKFGVGGKALYSAAPGLVLSADANFGRATGHTTSSVATPDGRIAQIGVGVDYAVTKSIHVSADYAHTAYNVAGDSVANNLTMVAVGLAY